MKQLFPKKLYLIKTKLIVLALTALLPFLSFQPTVSALFDPNYLIDDWAFIDTEYSVDWVQSQLVSIGGGTGLLANWVDDVDIYVEDATRFEVPGNRCLVHKATGLTAAQVINEAATGWQATYIYWSNDGVPVSRDPMRYIGPVDSCNQVLRYPLAEGGGKTVSPKVILATLQKEQTIVSATGAYSRDETVYVNCDSSLDVCYPSNEYKLSWAMGYGYTESGVRTNYKGFYNQVMYGAWQLRANYERSGGDDWDGALAATYGGYKVGQTYIIDGQYVTPQTRGTASLYYYTPHVSGNQHFVTIYSGWFPLWVNTPTLTYLSHTGFWNPSYSKFSVAGDFNGDGKDDIAAMYDYGGGKIGIWSFESNGTSLMPRIVYMGQAGYWNVEKTVFADAGDFNGDGKDDIAAMYDYGGGKIGIWSFESNGTSLMPRIVYMGQAGYWNVEKTVFADAGDFNGDGKDDIAAMYDYGGGKIGIWSFESNGTSLMPRIVYMGQAGYWNVEKTVFADAGDFNGDGKDDIAAMYDYGGGKIGIWSFQSNGLTLSPAILYLSHSGFWDPAHSPFSASGDFNGDGKDDIAAMYDYGASTIAIWDFESSGSSLTPQIVSSSSENCWNVLLTKWALSGDISGNTKDKLIMLYDYHSDQIGIWEFDR